MSSSSPANGFIRDLAGLAATMHECGQYSDLGITCQGKYFHVHRIVVCLQSKPLAAAMSSGFREGSSSIIDLKEDEFEIVEKAIQFMYNHKYTFPELPEGVKQAVSKHSSHASDERSTKGKGRHKTASCAASPKPTNPVSDAIYQPPGSLLVNAKIYVFAEKWDVPALKNFAAKMYASAVLQEWNSTSFSATLKLVYEWTPASDRLLRNIAVKTAAAHLTDLVDRGEFIDVCKESGELATDILLYKAKLQADTLGEHPMECDDCGHDECIIDVLDDTY